VAIAKILFVAAALFLLFSVGFSERQSLILSVIATVFYVASGRPITETPFAPFRMKVKPKLHAIVRDFELIEDTEEAWAELQREIQKLPHDDSWYACRDEFSFSLSYLTSSRLIYNHSSKDFMTDVDLSATFEPLALPSTKADSTFRHPPRLRLQVSLLSIELPKWHWEKIRHKEAFKGVDSKRHVDPVDEGDWVAVRLALIHWSEYQVHFVPAWEEAAIWTRKRREKFRLRFGWKGDDTNHIAVEHRYSTLRHSAL